MTDGLLAELFLKGLYQNNDFGNYQLFLTSISK